MPTSAVESFLGDGAALGGFLATPVGHGGQCCRFGGGAEDCALSQVPLHAASVTSTATLVTCRALRLEFTNAVKLLVVLVKSLKERLLAWRRPLTRRFVS